MDLPLSGDEILTAVAVTCDVMVYRLVEAYRHFRGMYCPSSFRFGISLLVCFLKYSSEDGGNTLLWNNHRHLPDYTASHPQKMVLFIPQDSMNKVMNFWVRLGLTSEERFHSIDKHSVVL